MKDSLICKKCLFVGCLTSKQYASVSQGRICSDNFTCCHTEIEVADQTFHLTQSQYTDTGPTGPSTDPITPGRVATGVPIFKSLVWLDPQKIPVQVGFKPGLFRSQGWRLTTRPMRRFCKKEVGYQTHKQCARSTCLREAEDNTSCKWNRRWEWRTNGRHTIWKQVKMTTHQYEENGRRFC